MAGGKNNTQRIETLESQAANIVARLDVQDTQLKGITEGLKKSTDSTQGHSAKLTVIEERLLVLVELKGSLGVVTSLDKDLALLKKDLEILQQWKTDLKKEKDEATRRWWSFGPNISAAIISGIITLSGIAFNYWLNKPK
jgi:DNA repair ATPase RecN